MMGGARQKIFAVVCAGLSVCAWSRLSDAAQTHRAAEQSDLKGRYYLIVWSYQGPDDDVVHAHTFTSFYRGDDLAKGLLRPATISWLPASGVVQLLGSERGRNFSLDETLQNACRAQRSVQTWGPYEIKPALYHRALQRMRLLQSGRIRYAMMNGAPQAMNCIKAAGDITAAPLDTGILWGVAAGAEVTRHLSPFFVSHGHAPGQLESLSNSKICLTYRGQAARHLPTSSSPGSRALHSVASAGFGF